FLPKGAPAEVVNKLNDATTAAMKTPSVRERLEGLGAVIVSEDRATPQYLAGFLKSDIEKWAGPIKASGVPGGWSPVLDLALDLVAATDPAERVRRLGREFLVALELALCQGLAHRLLDLALGADPKRLEKFPDAGVEDILVHDRLRRGTSRYERPLGRCHHERLTNVPALFL